MDDRELLGYLEIHAQTELGLVCRDHVCRLHSMAGVPCPGLRGLFYSIADHQADDLLEAARARQALPWLK